MRLVVLSLDVLGLNSVVKLACLVEDCGFECTDEVRVLVRSTLSLLFTHLENA